MILNAQAALLEPDLADSELQVDFSGRQKGAARCRSHFSHSGRAPSMDDLTLPV
jgi:hypothetical protein